MASYIDNALTPDERVIHRGHLSLWSMFGKIFVDFMIIIIGLFLIKINPLFTLFFFVIGIAMLLMVYTKYTTTELAITNKRIFAKVGFIRRSTIEMSIRKTESIQVNQGVIGRIFNYGSLIISGAGNPQAPIHGIADPMRFRSAFIDAQDKAYDR